MNKLVYSVFKAIMVSIIFVFVFDMASYLYLALSLNARIESLSTSLKKVVMENNYLPSEDATLYASLLGQIIADFNGVEFTGMVNGNMTFSDDVDNADAFIAGASWNYGTNADISATGLASLTATGYNSSGGTITRDILEKNMANVREYGDIQVVQIKVAVYQPFWSWGNAGTSNEYSYSGQDATAWTRNRKHSTHQFVYTYYVPCLKYKTTNTI
jgi:hypothetical protein